ncbi:MAG: hypothetical protein JWP87_4614 [Labilithrix sp.]|nr:hypothetical protein [Labilithrix sp.]
MARPNLGLRTRTRRTVVILLALAATAAAGCSGHDPYRPGESIGVFHVAGRLVSTTCGTTPDPWEFDVRLRHDSTTLFWVQGDAPIAGQVDGTARAILKSSNTQTMRPADEKTKTAACTMARSDVLDLVLAPMTAPVKDVGAATSFKGTLTYRFTATEGSSCDDQLLDSGGDFATLPCDVQYDLAGTRTGDAK